MRYFQLLVKHYYHLNTNINGHTNDIPDYNILLTRTRLIAALVAASSADSCHYHIFGWYSKQSGIISVEVLYYLSFV